MFYHTVLEVRIPVTTPSDELMEHGVKLKTSSERQVTLSQSKPAKAQPFGYSYSKATSNPNTETSLFVDQRNSLAVSQNSLNTTPANRSAVDHVRTTHQDTPISALYEP
jgi:hypothetical protein